MDKGKPGYAESFESEGFSGSSVAERLFDLDVVSGLSAADSFDSDGLPASFEFTCSYLGFFELDVFSGSSVAERLFELDVVSGLSAADSVDS